MGNISKKSCTVYFSESREDLRWDASRLGHALVARVKITIR